MPCGPQQPVTQPDGARSSVRLLRVRPAAPPAQAGVISLRRAGSDNAFIKPSGTAKSEVGTKMKANAAKSSTAL